MQIDSILNITIFILLFIFLYLLLTRVLMKRQPSEEEYKREVTTNIEQTRETQVRELLTENELYALKIKEAKEKYKKKKLKVDAYKETVKDYQERIQENDTRIRELQIENDEQKN